MLEYVFFSEACVEPFVAEVERRALPYTTALEPMDGGTIIQVAEPLPDEDWDALDELYDVLNVRDQQLMEASSEDSMSVAGIYLQLTDGRQTLARIDPDVMNRILQVVSLQEFNALLEVVVKSVEEPDDSAICSH